MKDFKWLHTETVIAIHRLQIAEHRGSDGMRDLGLLLSALARPKNLVTYGSDPDIPGLAASLAFGIVRNHPFVDGNKRTALVAARTFIIMNGYDLKASQEEKYVTFMKMADGSLDEAELAEWIRHRLETVAETYENSP